MIRKASATFFGLGYLPGAPGTWGSAGAYIVWLGLLRTQTPRVATGVAAVVATGCAFFLARHAQADFGAEDPKQFVMDEVAGFFVGALFIAPPTVWWGGAAGVALFALFRALDTLKPFPICRLERVGGSAAVVLDDLAAGLAAGVLTLIAAAVFPWMGGAG